MRRVKTQSNLKPVAIACDNDDVREDVAAELNTCPIHGVDVEFFCLAMKWLGEHYPNRACAEPLEKVRQALTEAEFQYSQLPLMPSKGARHA